MNQITIAGHLGADPEVRFTSSGKKVTTLRVAARVRKGKDETIWWKVTIWGEEFDKMIPYFKKGSAIIVCGELSKPEIFTDREGRPQVSMNVTAFHIGFNPFGRSEQPAAHEGSEMRTQPASASPLSDGQEMAHAAQFGQGQATPTFSDDEIPF